MKNTTINYIAFGDGVVVDPKIEPKTDKITLTESTIKAMSDEKTKHEFVEVVAVGDDVKNIQVGDMIAIAYYANPTSIPIDGKRYFQFHANEVLGKKYKATPKELAN